MNSNVQSLEVAGISFDLIIIRIWQGTSTEQTQAFAQAVPHPFKPRTRRASLPPTSRLAEQGTLELQVMASPEGAVGSDSKNGALLDI